MEYLNLQNTLSANETNNDLSTEEQVDGTEMPEVSSVRSDSRAKFYLAALLALGLSL